MRKTQFPLKICDAGPFGTTVVPFGRCVVPQVRCWPRRDARSVILPSGLLDIRQLWHVVVSIGPAVPVSARCGPWAGERGKERTRTQKVLQDGPKAHSTLPTSPSSAGRRPWASHEPAPARNNSVAARTAPPHRLENLGNPGEGFNPPPSLGGTLGRSFFFSKGAKGAPGGRGGALPTHIAKTYFECRHVTHARPLATRLAANVTSQALPRRLPLRQQETHSESQT